MRPERLQRIEELYHSALGREQAEREAFVRDACAGDEELLREVASLLASYQEAADFIEEPVVEKAIRLLLDDHHHSLVGRQIAHYKIVSLLGAGGMGEVYLAEDTKLGRKVALKLLPAYLTTEAERLRRFKQEARTASALNHPNILTIHEIGEAEGQYFIVTEFIEGATLRDHMANSRMSVDAALDVGLQVAVALEAAHAKGIVHRDIKPENIMLRGDGYAKVLDFGLAKLTERRAAEMEASTLANTEPGVDGHGGLHGAGAVVGPTRRCVQ